MLDKQKAYLCVGGPHDGRRICSEQLEMRVAVPTYPSRPLASIYNVPSEIREIKTMIYVADRVKFGTSDEVWFWRPQDQSPGDTLRKLLERYEQSANLLFHENPWQEKR